MTNKDHVTTPRFEHTDQALGMGASCPRLSWTVETVARNWRQSAYEIELCIAQQAPQLSGRLASDQSVLVPWPFAALESRQAVDVRVRVWDQDGEMTGWSEAAHTETGLLEVSDWSAGFISPDWDEDSRTPLPDPYLRKEFTVRAGIDLVQSWCISFNNKRSACRARSNNDSAAL